jgi:serine/threonine-protein kinase mTOR
VKEPIRQEAAKALSSCLSALVQRTYHLQWYCAVYEQVLLGFAQGTPEAVHGSLLVVAELLKHTGDFMIPRYKEVRALCKHACPSAA